MNNIGKNIKNIRLKSGIYQNELAKKVGCTQAHISGIEHGKELTVSLLLKITNALGCQIADIIN